ncbi:MAG TPA: hypothetical protein VF712_01135, partial [Thermoleophilaceae bacterium]
MLRACVAIAALSLLIGSTPTYDSWAWMTWGREIAGGLDFDTSVGPAWKPLPVLVGAIGGPFGDLAPALWLTIARAGVLASVALAARLAWRLASGSVLAAGVAAACVALRAGWVWNGWLGSAEGLMLALVLGAFSLALDGRHRAALALGFAAALMRTEVVPFLALYAAWLWWRSAVPRSGFAALPRRDVVVAACGFAALPLVWLVPDL